MKKSVWTICFALFWTVLTPAQAQQKENLKQIEDYLNNIKTMQASFVQTASNGNTAEGMPVSYTHLTLPTNREV